MKNKSVFNKSHSNSIYLWSAIGLLIFLNILNYSLCENIPFLDDTRAYHGINRIDNLPTLAEKVHHFFTYHTNEHRIITYRAAYLLLNKLFGNLNLLHLILISQIFLIGIFWIFYKIISKNNEDRWWIPLLVIIVFVPLQGFSNWPLYFFIVSISLFFSFLSLYLLSLSKINFYIIAIFCAVISTFSFGSGMFAFLAGLPILIFQKRTKIVLVVWLLFTLGSMYLYFNGLELPAHRPSKLNVIRFYFVETTTFPFILSTSFFKEIFGEMFFVQLLFGIGFISSICYIIYIKFSKLKEEPVYLGFTLYFIFLIAASSLSRGYWGVETGNIDRYQYVSALLVAALLSIFVFLYKDWTKKHNHYILLIGFVLFISRAGHNIPVMQAHKKKLITQLTNYHLGLRNNLNGSLLDLTIAKGTYKSPIGNFHKNQVNLEPFEIPNKVYEIYGDIKLIENNNWIKLSGFGFVKDVLGLSNKKSLLFKESTTGQMYQIEVENIYNSKLVKKEPFRSMNNSESKKYQVKKASFELVLNKDLLNLPTGNYELGIFVIEQNEYSGVKFFEKYIIVE